MQSYRHFRKWWLISQNICIYDKENEPILFSRWPHNLHTNPLISLHFDDSFYFIRAPLLMSDYNMLSIIILTCLNQSVFFTIANLAEAGNFYGDYGRCNQRWLLRKHPCTVFAIYWKHPTLPLLSLLLSLTRKLNF